MFCTLFYNHCTHNLKNFQSRLLNCRSEVERDVKAFVPAASSEPVRGRDRRHGDQREKERRSKHDYPEDRGTVVTSSNLVYM